MLTYEQIKEIIVSIDSSLLRNFELEVGDMKLKLSKNKESLNIINNDESSLGKSLGYSSKIESTNSIRFNEKVQEEIYMENKVTEIKEKLESKSKESIVNEDLKEVKAPIVGTYYSSKTPGGEPYVKIGSQVKKGDILCIVEAMKIMNEIVSEYDGEIVKILSKDEEIVEFGMSLFKIREVN